MRISARAPSRKTVLSPIVLLAFVAVGLLIGSWFNSQVKVRSAAIYGEVLPSAFSTTNQVIYIDAYSPTTAYNGYMDTSGTSPGLLVQPLGNNSFKVQLNENLTGASSAAFYISSIPVTRGVTVKNYTFNLPFTYQSSSAGPPYVVPPFDLEVRLLASSPVGTISWQSYIFNVGYHNPGLDDTRALTAEINLVLFAAAAMLLWGIITKVVSRKSLPAWFPVGTIALLCLVLVVYVFVGSAFEIYTPGWEPSWAWLFFPFAHQGFSHLSGNLYPFLIASLSLELILRKFGRRRLYYLAFGFPVLANYVVSLIGSSAGVSILLGVFAVSLWGIIQVYRSELLGRVDMKWVLVAILGSGLALAGVTVTYLEDLTLSLPLQNTFWLVEAIWHPSMIALEGGLTWFIVWFDKRYGQHYSPPMPTHQNAI